MGTCLEDAIYLVGGSSRNQGKFNADVTDFLHRAYKQYKTICVAQTGQSFIQPSEQNNLAGVVFTMNNPNFDEDFVSAIAQQRFWNRN